ncbi:hypothetical protein MKK75_17015 [Methylobacterium sp. J-030]|uniref:hypothetical protein n=1 Tax=Methylobacterium sp. J-030 TaxID=2836627 RepID=UPI001FBB150A|nr:hypothetical protein [Methylobacterium sp. J-030]MCJ2070478.1 hypothetical protein [Methylobacterium sp. J-030]
MIAGKAQTKGAVRLREIAHLLGEREDFFFDQPMGGAEYSDAFELLQLCRGMKSAADRQKLLNFAQTLAVGRK